MTDEQNNELATGIIAAHLVDSGVSWDKVARYTEVTMEEAGHMMTAIFGRLLAEGFSEEEIMLLLMNTAGNVVGMVEGLVEAREEMQGEG